jgi:tetratricopeptide (TPR) repeat protein
MAEKSTTLSNLPPMPDHGIIGREKELEGVITALLDPDIPIVTLLGLAGTGKTALALAVAHRLREQGEFSGGIVWLNASAVQSLADMWETIRRAFDLPSPQAAQRHLREHPTLLILDGLNEAAQDMGMLTFLDHLPRPSKVLVTSRERVGLLARELVVSEGEGSMAVRGNVHGDIITGDKTKVTISLGSLVDSKIAIAGRDVHIRGDFEGRDQVLKENYPVAIEICRQALASLDPARLSDDHRRYAEISHRLGVCLRLDGQWGQAVEQQEETFRQFKRLRDFYGQGRAYLEIARAYQAMNSYDLAVLYYNDAYRLFKRAGDVALAATVREEMGNLKYYLRILKPAMTDWEEAARLYEQAGRPGKVAIIRQNLAQVQSS